MKLRILKSVTRIGAIATVLCVCSATSFATLSVTFDSIVVAPGTTSATSFVRISSDQNPLERFQAANVNLQVEAILGREIKLNSYTPTPTGNVWEGVPLLSGSANVLDGTQTATKISTSITNGSDVDADGGILFAMDFDTSAGIAGDVFTVNLDNLLGNNVSEVVNHQGTKLTAAFGGVTFSPGTITISQVPEPSSFLLIGLCGCLGCAVQWWRKRHAAA